MSTQKAKFELFTRLQALGFTYEEAAALRRIEMTLHRWAEAECNGEIQRAGENCDGKPFRVYEQSSNARHYPIADRERGALKRASLIVTQRNNRENLRVGTVELANCVHIFHQGDPRGCALYLVKHTDLPKHHIETQPELETQLSQYYTRGLAVCA